VAGRRIAVVLFNLGGPDGPAAVRPFLFNLFSDRAIIGLPAVARLPLAVLISTLRARSARANYAIMGGGSPLLPETEKQAAALKTALGKRFEGDQVETFIAMRYWKPFTGQTAKKVAAFGPDEIILLPLYPQYSTTTTGSSLKAWKAAYKGSGRTREVCCYPTLPGLIEAHAAHIRDAVNRAEGAYRLLFSAHGLPEKVIAAGDPYQKQVEATAAAIVAALKKKVAGQIDWRVCYQSRVGPMAWIGPSTAEAIESAAIEGIGVVIAPIAFVSEHIETLVELDHDYRRLADGLECPTYVRVPALGLAAAFIEGLAGAAASALDRDGGSAPGEGWTPDRCGPICPCLQGTIA
jgi:ferrochelatase